MRKEYESELTQLLCASLACNEAVTTTNQTASSELTYAKILQAKKLMENGKDPLAEYMKKNGFDPAKGDMLVVPEKNKAEISQGYPLPPYVKTSKFQNTICMVKSPPFALSRWNLQAKKAT